MFPKKEAKDRINSDIYKIQDVLYYQAVGLFTVLKLKSTGNYKFIPKK